MDDQAFKNFNVGEEFFFGMEVTSPFGSGYLEELIFQAASTCGKWESSGNSYSQHYPTSIELINLGIVIDRLAADGYEKRASITWMTNHDSINFFEHSVSDWAIHGKEQESESNINIAVAQIYAFTALRLIDNSITEAGNGISIKFIEDLAQAACLLVDAREAESNDFFSHLKTTDSARLEIAVKARESEMARRRAIQRHAVDPRQTEKAFVFECWKDWQAKLIANDKTYTSKAKFSADMLTKCEQLTSAKVIADWCKEWETSKKMSAC